MVVRIKQLSPELANQIAAGEVIERPASVVKELLENAYDAGAHSIHIEVLYGGLNRIKITDDGAGIDAEDLPLAVSAHATSKISTLNDLYSIESMGFRGEALASIASIAKVDICSRPAHQEHAMKLIVDACGQRLEPSPRSQGTTIDVCDLFYNAPVRKRFLKSEKMEFAAIEGVVKRFALSAPHIAITLKHNDREVLKLPEASSSAKKRIRMEKIFGAGFVKDAIYLDVAHLGLTLSGWISGHQYNRSQNDRLWVYVNQRMVKDKLIHHAIRQAYDEIIYPGRFPACLLYLGMDSKEVDVNVHPTKHEVRFYNPRLVHDFLTSQITQALLSVETEQESMKEKAPAVPAELPLTLAEPKPAFYQSLQSYSPKVVSNSSWIALNKRYVLFFKESIPYIIDIVAVQKNKVFEQLKSADRPLPSRPLLVPVRCVPPLLSDTDRAHFIEILASAGMSVKVDMQGAFTILTIPVALPYLDISTFFASVDATKAIDYFYVVSLMSQCQVISPEYFTDEERAVLLEGLEKHGKALTEQECERILYDV